MKSRIEEDLASMRAHAIREKERAEVAEAEVARLEQRATDAIEAFKTERKEKEAAQARIRALEIQLSAATSHQGKKP